MPDRFEQYLDTAGEQIRWRRARPALLRELRTHLLEEESACLDRGMTPEEAEVEAIRQMGDPVFVGAELDRVHRPKRQIPLLVLTLLLAVTCAFLRAWLTAGWRFDANDPVKTALAALLGGTVLVGAYLFDSRLLLRNARWIYLAGILGSILLLLFSPRVQGVAVWARQLAALYPILYAFWVYSWKSNGWKGVFLAIVGGVPLAILGCMAPGVPAVFLLMVTGFLLLLAAAWLDWFGLGRLRTVQPVLWTALLLLIPAAMSFHRGYAVHRISRMLHPEQDPFGYGYQALTVRNSLTASKWLGQGGFDPEMVPDGAWDFLPTTLIGRLGWLSYLVLLAGLAVLLVWLLVRGLRQKNGGEQLLVLAAVLPLVLRILGSAMLNLGYVLFSMACPLLVGNTQMVLDLVCIGLVLSLFRQETLPCTA